jgi:hypothetical protein
LLGQDPSKPVPETTGTTTEKPASSRPVPPESLAANPENTFDPAELIEDFEHLVCERCMGTGSIHDRVSDFGVRISGPPPFITHTYRASFLLACGGFRLLLGLGWA